MKLTGIAIDGYHALTNVKLMQISPSMNLIYGEKGAGKTRIADFISSVLFGQSSVNAINATNTVAATANPAIRSHQPLGGKLEISHTTGQFALSRDPHNRLTVTPTAGGSHAIAAAGSINSLSPPAGSVDSGLSDAGLYKSFFNVNFDSRISTNPTHSSNQLADALNQRLHVPIGPQAAGESTVSQQQLQAAASLRMEIETLNASIYTLKQRSQQLTSQINAMAASSANSVQRGRELDQQIAELERRIAGLTFNPHAQELTLIANEIQQLQHAINTAKPTYVAPVVAVPQSNNTEMLYELLDEVDLQIGRWQSVQNDIQQQRVVLKDEMLLWNKLTLDSPQHPYHNARKLLLKLESRVDQANSKAMQWLDSHGPVDSNQAAGFVNEVSQALQGDLYDLCEDLGNQYRQLRHRAAAAELKRLRQCYEEMAENVARLLQRRQEIIQRIRTADPAGADVIVRAEESFRVYAAQEGHFKARQRFLGAMPTTAATSTIAPQMIAPDQSKERSRLLVLESRRAELQSQGTNNSLELTQLRAQESNLRNERNSLMNVADDRQLKLELTTVDGELQRGLAALQSLNVRLNEANRASANVPDPILTEAAKNLVRLSHGELTRVWLASGATGTELHVQDRHQRVLNSSALSATMRAQTQLSLILAACQALAAKGVSAPLVIDELFQDFDSDRIDTALQCLSEFAKRGHQVIMLTQHRFLIDRANNFGTVQFFDIESSAVAASPVSVPVVSVAPTPQYTPPVINATVAPVVSMPTPTAVPNVLPATLAFSDARKYSNGTAGSAPKYTEPKTVRFQPVAQPKVASIKASQIGDRLEYAVTFEEHSQLSDIPIFDSIQLRTFNESGIHSVADLLNIDVNQLPREWAESGLSASVIENMQSEIWLLTCVPALRPYDAHVLVACGISEPDQLDTSAPQILSERVQRYLNANTAEHDFEKDYQITIGRINDWHKGIAKTRSRWRNGRSSRSSSRSRTQNHDRHSQQSGHSNDRSYRGRYSNDRQRNGREDFDRRGERNGQSERNGLSNHRDLDRDSIESHNSNATGPRISRYTANGQQHENYRDSSDRKNGSVRPDREQSDRDYSPRDSGRRNEGTRYEDQRSDQQSSLADDIIRADRASDLPNSERYSDDSQSQPVRSSRMMTPTPETIRRSVPALAPESNHELGRESLRERDVKPAAVRSSPQAPKTTNLKFYLDLEDHIEAAPSIGPKTAERFEKIGVFTISDFSEADRRFDGFAIELQTDVSRRCAIVAAASASGLPHPKSSRPRCSAIGGV